jgi:hypothetical protein
MRWTCNRSPALSAEQHALIEALARVTLNQCGAKPCREPFPIFRRATVLMATVAIFETGQHRQLTQAIGPTLLSGSNRAFDGRWMRLVRPAQGRWRSRYRDRTQSNQRPTPTSSRSPPLQTSLSVTARKNCVCSTRGIQRHARRADCHGCAGRHAERPFSPCEVAWRDRSQKIHRPYLSSRPR